MNIHLTPGTQTANGTCTTNLENDPQKLIALRIKYLIKRLNTENMAKWKRKEITRELHGYGVIPLRRHDDDKVKTVIVKTNSGYYYDKFEIKGKIHTFGTSGDDIIGYYCDSCLMATNIDRMVNMVIVDPATQLKECSVCGAHRIIEIFEHNIIGRA